jgi:uncharacterized RDD family membrane protein YckC
VSETGTPEPGTAPTGRDATPGGPPSFPGNAPPPPPAPPAGSAAGPPAFPVWSRTPGGGPPPSGTEPSTSSTYASWGIRLGGYLIDTAIFLVVLVVLLVVFRHSQTLDVHLMARRGMRRRHISALPFLITGVLYVVYGTLLCGSSRGQTVGMMAVGVRAVREGSNEVLGYGRALARAVVEGALRLIDLLSFFLGLIWVLDMLFPLWDKKRQTLHDKVAGSVVLRLRPAG